MIPIQSSIFIFLLGCQADTEKTFDEPTRGMLCPSQDIGTPENLDREDLYQFSYDNLNVVEKWFYETRIDLSSSAPEFIEFANKSMLFIDRSMGQSAGIASYETTTGLDWQGGQIVVENPLDGHHSHPFGATDPQGRMVLFMQTKTNETLTINRSVSVDGRFFEPVTGPNLCAQTGGNNCDHGRILQLEDDCYLMALNTEIHPQYWSLDSSYLPGTILGYSSDLDTWTFGDTYFRGCHDPTFDQTPDGISIYCHSELTNGLLRFDSTDGYDFDPLSPAGHVEFYDRSGVLLADRIAERTLQISDPDKHFFSSGAIRFYLSVTENLQEEGNNFPTIFSFIP